MKILLTGAGGMLGSALWTELSSSDHELIGTDLLQPACIPNEQFIQMDITHKAQTYQIVSKCNPDLIIHTAGYTDVDGCEINQDHAYRVNGTGTRNLLLGAQRFDSGFLYISTDYVFGSDDKKSYREYDVQKVNMHYAHSKQIGEEFVKSLSSKYYIVRSSWLFGKSRSNYVVSMIESIKHKKPYRAADDMTASPTYVVDLARAVRYLIEQETYGVYHITNQGQASRYEVACEIGAYLKSSNVSNIQQVKLDTLGLAAKRPHYSILENYMWHLEGNPPMRHWKDAVKDFIKEVS
ncbi:MAG: dTDP-4-dehydrorhamnose reductase [bacterium]